MSQLPQGWELKTFGDVLSLVTNGVNGKQNKEGIGVPVSRIETIADQKIDLERIGYLESYDEEKIEKYKLQENDILFSHINSALHLGKTAIVPSNVNLYHGVNLLRLAVNELAEPRYFNYYCKYFRLLGEFSAHAQHAVNQSSLNQKKLKAFNIPLAPIQQQKSIADKLDSVLAKVEAAQARLDKIPTILKRFRQSALAAATSGELTKDWREENNVESAANLLKKFSEERKKLLDAEVADGNKETKRLISKLNKHNPLLPDADLPAGWVWTSFMSSMVKVVDCHNKTAPYIDAGIPLIRTPDIRNGVISLEGAKYISEETYDYWSRRCPPEPGDIIFTREAPMGEAGIVPEGVKLCMGQRMMLLRPDTRYVSPDYLVFNTLSLDFKERMNGQAIGTGVKHLRVADVEALTYPLPPYEEQLEVVERVTELFEHANTVEKQYNAAKARLDKLTQSILAKAFRGELLLSEVDTEVDAALQAAETVSVQDGKEKQ